MKFLFVVLAIVGIVYGQPTRDGEQKKVCTPGSSFKQSCNDCFCSEDGFAMRCTLKFCVDEETPRVCSPGDTKQEDCNTCRCSEDGSDWACTFALCEPKIPCTRTGAYKKFCNTCGCSPDGTEHCTKMACDPKIWNEDGSLRTPLPDNIQN